MRLKTENGIWVITENAEKKWEEERATSVFSETKETLYRSRKKRYYIVKEGQGRSFDSSETAKFISDEDAALWLFKNKHELPDDLKKFEPE